MRFAFPHAPGDLIGTHLSTKGGLHTAFERAAEVAASSIAIFAKNSGQWKGKALSDEDCARFSQSRCVEPVLTHASYLINLATTNPDFHRKSGSNRSVSSSTIRVSVASPNCWKLPSRSSTNQIAETSRR